MSRTLLIQGDYTNVEIKSDTADEVIRSSAFIPARTIGRTQQYNR
jgi:hypothetical protein